MLEEKLCCAERELFRAPTKKALIPIIILSINDPLGKWRGLIIKTC